MVLLSFDTEEFDLPKEYGVDIPIEDSMAVSAEGTELILDILHSMGVRATFFCTTTFAKYAPQTMRRIIDDGHEVAAHGCDHSNPLPQDIAKSKIELERQYGICVKGYRQPRMSAIDVTAIEECGYSYDASLHPTFIPGRYMHLDLPRTPITTGKVLEIPASVSPWIRIPVFWLACHNYPFWLYKMLCKWTWKHDGQFVIYFHPWEFVDLNRDPAWKIPFIIRRNSGKGMQARLKGLIDMLQHQGAKFVTYTEFTNIFNTRRNRAVV